ncbi:hypothetical protein HMPREF9442_00592 [Paraprevotella xylaniphila YIT 11841]|uniref:Uncharacterized protein n=1 Tax=Paraprevotella xylaniphila YIT 11841 TaxID=762982 RepID=F3QQZ8_9BACT|nr:hypothetical protein HMPREF9442_00592 [Paraprevotella xylaniphila YIT 11841]
MFVSALFRTLLCRLPVFFIIQFMKTELTVGFFFTLDILPLKEKTDAKLLYYFFLYVRLSMNSCLLVALVPFCLVSGVASRLRMQR